MRHLISPARTSANEIGWEEEKKEQREMMSTSCLLAIIRGICMNEKNK
jgi:hypothetical protein